MKGKHMLYDTRNPYAETIRNAENLQVSLHNICTDFELSIEQRQLAIQAYTTAQRAYQEQESEFLFELSVDPNSILAGVAKTSKQYEWAKDSALIKARNNGPLRMAWGALNQATKVRDNAELAYSQMDARFKAVRVAAELQAAMLRAAALG